ncbi:MAG: hypothetical protein ACI8SE_001415 [Bacteroidia bacterium]
MKAVKYVYIALVLSLFSCSKTELSGLENSGALVIGDQKDFKLISVVPYPDGGFIVGAETRRNLNQEMLVQFYSDDFELKWEHTLGGSEGNKLHKIFIDRDKQILVVGLTYGHQSGPRFGNHKFWRPYAQLYTTDGALLWDRLISATNFAGGGSGILERVADIIQNETGDYIIGGEYAQTPGISSTYINLSRLGDSVYMVSIDGDRRGKVEALYPNVSSSHITFTYWQDSLSQTPIANLSNLFLDERIQIVAGKKNIEWPWSNGYENGSVARLKFTSSSGRKTFNYFFPEAVFQYSFTDKAEDFRGDFVPFDFTQIMNANTTYDNHFMLAQRNGTIIETDENFDIINKFETDWQPQQLCKLYNGEYILAVYKNKIIYLLHYDVNGTIK